MTDILHAKVGGPPDDWQGLVVLLDGAELLHVTEANAEEGWAIVLKRDDAGEFVAAGCDLVTEKVTGKIEIYRRRAQ